MNDSKTLDKVFEGLNETILSMSSNESEKIVRVVEDFIESGLSPSHVYPFLKEKGFTDEQIVVMYAFIQEKKVHRVSGSYLFKDCILGRIIVEDKMNNDLVYSNRMKEIIDKCFKMIEDNAPMVGLYDYCRDSGLNDAEIFVAIYESSMQYTSWYTMRRLAKKEND
jgi:hypothetical protein